MDLVFREMRLCKYVLGYPPTLRFFATGPGSAQALALHLQSMRTPSAVLRFAADHQDADVRTLEATLRALGRTLAESKGSRGRAQVIADHRFHLLVATLSARLGDCDTRSLALSVDAAARFRSPTPELVELAERAAELLDGRENSLKPRKLAMVSLALSSFGVSGLRQAAGGKRSLGAAVLFVRGESMRHMQDFDPHCCATMLEAFRRWKVSDPELTNVILERMSDTIDDFTCKDVVETFVVMSKLGLTRAKLLRPLCQLTFQGLKLGRFSARQLVTVLYALARLRFISERDVGDVIEVLMPDLGSLTDLFVSQLVFAIGMVGGDRHLDIARVLIRQYVEGSDGTKNMTSDIDICWAMCSLGFAPRYKDEVASMVTHVSSCAMTTRQELLLKFHDVISAMDFSFKKKPISVCSVWRTACSEAMQREMDRVKSSRWHAEVANHFADFHLMSPWSHIPPFDVCANQKLGPCHVDFLDTATQVVVDLDMVSWPMTRHIRHRILQDMNYRPVCLEFWDWDAIQSSTGKGSFLAHKVVKALRGKS